MGIRPPFWLRFRVMSRRALLGAATSGAGVGPPVASPLHSPPSSRHGHTYIANPCQKRM